MSQLSYPQISAVNRADPRPHQQEAITAVVKGFKSLDRGKLLMACGTGKTLTSLWIKEALNAGRTLVLLPSLNLLSQTLKVWTEQSQTDMNWICVCSDKTVAKKDKSSDEWVVNLSQLGIPVTSSPNDIREFLLQEPNGVVFSTYQSSMLIEDAQKQCDVPSFDIAFADEAHRCAGKVTDAYGCILDGQKIRAEKRLFMTATPRILSSAVKLRASGENIEVACMDDKSIFGDVFYELKFSQAIQDDLLCDYKVVIVGVDDPTVQASISSRSEIHLDTSTKIDCETLANHVGLAKAVSDYGLKRVITFHNKVKYARDFSQDHPQIAELIQDKSESSRIVKSGFVSGEMNSNLRTQQLDILRSTGDSEVSILSNARCLSEGIDVPSLDGVAFINPRGSVVDITQAVGRAIRRSDGKDCGYVILPVYLGDGQDLDEEILQTRFRQIWQVLLSLKSQDDSLSDALDGLRISKGSSKSKPQSPPTLPEKIEIDLPDRIPSEFIDSLKTRVVLNTTEDWKERYGEYLKYLEDHQGKHPEVNHPTLGGWISNQRVNKKNGTLSQERVDLLDEINFVWDKFETKWMMMYGHVKEFFEANGHCLIPSTHPTFGIWVREQRRLYANGKLGESRQKLLEDIDFPWDGLKDHQWYMKFYKLREIYQNTGSSEVPTTSALYSWSKEQRKTYKLGALEECRVVLLDSIEFRWESIRLDWDSRFASLKDHYQKFGVQQLERSNDLYVWVQRQRRNRKVGSLSQKQIELLDEIGFIWDFREFKWDSRFNELVTYKESFGDTLVPDNSPLGHWVYNQRLNFKQGKLSPAHLRRLRDIDFAFTAPDQRFRADKTD